MLKKRNRALHTRPWIRIRSRLGTWIQRPLCLHTTSIRIRAGCCAAWQCSRTVCEVQSSRAMRVVCVRCGAPAKPYWIRIRDPDPVNLVRCPCGKFHYKSLSWFSNGVKTMRMSSWSCDPSTVLVSSIQASCAH